MSYQVTLSDVFLDDLKAMITAGVKAAMYQDESATQDYLNSSIYEYDTQIAAAVREAFAPYIKK